MCNLYSMTATVDELRRIFGGFEGERDNLPPYDEIYPGKLAPVLRKSEGGALRLEMMRWGFPGPAAAKSRPITNVRNLDSPFWRSTIANPAQRCLVPFTSFAEPKPGKDPETGRPANHWFTVAGEEVCAFAGIWRFSEGRRRFAFLTCEPNPLVAPLHPKAMPVILQPEDYDRWLDGEAADACSLAQPFPSQLMAVA